MTCSRSTSRTEFRSDPNASCVGSGHKSKGRPCDACTQPGRWAPAWGVAEAMLGRDRRYPRALFTVPRPQMLLDVAAR